MSARTTDPGLIEVVKLLKRRAKEVDANIWDALAEELRKSRRNRVSVDLSRINRHSSEDETVLVPGKVLGSGILTHRVNVAALSFSRQAREKIEGAGGRCLALQVLVQENPRGSRIRIIG